MSRIRHATETFVNNLIDSVKKLIESNTNEIGVLSEKDVALEEQINVLSKDRGYLNSFTSGADLNTFTQNGIYAYSQLSANKPSQTFGYLFVSDWGKGYCRQFVQDSKNACYVRLLDNNVWSEWESLATTTKTDILWQGYQTSGDITLSKDISSYDYLIIHSVMTVGKSYSSYTMEDKPVKNGFFCVIGASGTPISFTIDSSGTKFTDVDYRDNRITKIIAVKRGN